MNGGRWLGASGFAPGELLHACYAWGDGDIMDLEISRATDAVRVALWGETNKPHSLQVSPDFTNWSLLISNTPVNSFFEFLDTNAPALDRRFYRGVKP
jgi:hypothetical protein